MKILYIVGFYPNNPRNIKMIKELEKKYIVKSCFWNNNQSKILDCNCKDYIFTSSKVKGKISKLLKIWSFYKYIKKVLKDYQPNCIFAYHWDMFILIRLATLGKDVKIVYDISDIPAYNGFFHKFLKFIEEHCINKNIFLMYASPYFKEKYVKFKKNYSFVINNKPEKEFMNKYLKFKELHLQPVAIFLGVFRDFEVFKNIFLAAKDLPIMIKMHGSGFLKNKIENYSKNFENVFIGQEFEYDELAYFYSGTDIVLSLYSNKDENTRLALGNKFFEAIAMKKIGIFPKGTKMGDYVIKKNIGIAVDPYNIDEIRKAFLEILTETENIKKIKENLSKIEEEEIFYEYEVKKFLPLLENFILNK